MLAVAAVSSRALAQDTRVDPLNPFRAERLAPGVYAMIQDPPARVSDSNVLVIINDEDVVVVDANILPSSAKYIIQEIRRLTAKPVRYVVNTHWHSDHHYGNAVYRDAFPGVEFIQHARTRRDIIERDVPALKTNLETEYPATLARYRNLLATNKTSAGAPLTDSLRTEVMGLVRLYEAFLTELSATPVIPGTLTFQDSLILHRGDRQIVIQHLGRGNTSGDVIVHLPKERIVATGDLVVHPIPFSFFSTLSEWPATLRAIRKLPADVIMPGHGAVQRNWEYLDQLVELTESTWNQVRLAVMSGANLDSTRRKVDLERFRVMFAGKDERQRRLFDYLFAGPAVEAAYSELRPDTTKKQN